MNCKEFIAECAKIITVRPEPARKDACHYVYWTAEMQEFAREWHKWSQLELRYAVCHRLTDEVKCAVLRADDFKTWIVVTESGARFFGDLRTVAGFAKEEYGDLLYYLCKDSYCLSQIKRVRND